MNLKKNPELIPLIEWWEKDGKQLTVWLLAAAIAFGGWYAWKNHRQAMKIAASDALVSAYTVEELEAAAVKFSGSAAGGAIKLRLAKSYYDAGRYQEALDQYAALEGASPDGFADIPAVGRAMCLEALGKFDEALAAFDKFAEENPKNYLTLTARLGAARCICQKGDRQKALARIDAIKSSVKDDEISSARVEATETAIKRYVKKAAPAAAPAEAKKPLEGK